MTDDAELLRRYAEQGAEEAFGQLVARYFDLVFSAALRQTGADQQLAQDVAQKTFTALAAKARSLPREVVLGGWLYRHSCFVARQLVRTECRRRRREQVAAEMSVLEEGTEPSWAQLAPFLDEAMQQLGGCDRDAIILRYFERRDLRSVGLALGTSEEAARKRVARALDKLRVYLRRRGLECSAAALAGLLTAEAVTAAPVGLIPGIAAAALGGGSVAGLAKLMALLNTKVALSGALVVAGLATPLVLQHHAAERLRQENLALRAQAQQLEQLRAENQRLHQLAPSADELARLRQQEGELLQLRGQVGVLREQLQQQLAQRPSKPPPATPPADTASPVMTFAATAQAQLANRDTLVTGGWAAEPGRRLLVFVTPRVDGANLGAGQVRLEARLVEGPETFWTSVGLGSVRTDDQGGSPQNVLGQAAWTALQQNLEHTSGVDVTAAPSVETHDGVQANVSVIQHKTVPGATEPVTVGPSIDLLPRLAPDQQSINLTVHAQLKVLKHAPPP